jgi:hypothetical protein
MSLSCILLAAPKRLHLWREVGASMIAILVQPATNLAAAPTL